MTYAVQQDLETRFGAQELVELTDRAGGNTIDAAVVAKALADADALVDTYLAGRYAVPVSPAPPLLVRLAADIARFFLHGKTATDSVRRAYDDALKTLGEIARGVAGLAGAAPSAAGAAGAPAYAAGERVFTPDSLRDFSQ